MAKRVSLIAVLALLTAVPGGSQEVCPCVPISYQWISVACETFDCAMTELTVGAGTPYIIAVPTGGSKFKWVVVKRVVAGTAVVSPSEPSVVDTYSTMAAAATQYDTLDPATLPKMLSTIDGKSLIIRFKEADPERRRGVRGGTR